LAHSKSALKRWRQNERQRERNKTVRTSARTAVKKARAGIAGGAEVDAAAAVREAVSVLDGAAKRNIIHKNAASRHKSRLMRRLNEISGGAAAAAPKKRRAPAKKAAAKKAPAKRATKSTKK